MCLAVPGKILSVSDSGDPVIGRKAMIDFQGSRLEASLAMTPEAGPGDWVLVHAGFAMTVLDEEEARQNWEMLRQALGDEVELVGNAPGSAPADPGIDVSSPAGQSDDDASRPSAPDPEAASTPTKDRT